MLSGLTPDLMISSSGSMAALAAQPLSYSSMMMVFCSSMSNMAGGTRPRMPKRSRSEEGKPKLKIHQYPLHKTVIYNGNTDGTRNKAKVVKYRIVPYCESRLFGHVTIRQHRKVYYCEFLYYCGVSYCEFRLYNQSLVGQL